MRSLGGVGVPDLWWGVLANIALTTFACKEKSTLDKYMCMINQSVVRVGISYIPQGEIKTFIMHLLISNISIVNTFNRLFSNA